VGFVLYFAVACQTECERIAVSYFTIIFDTRSRVLA